MKPFTHSIIILTFTFLLANNTFGQVSSRSIGDSLHAHHYDIHLRNINPSNNTIEAFTGIKLVSRVDNLAEIMLQLRDLTIDTLWLNGTITTNFTHDGEIITVPLSSPISQDDTVIVKVAYQGEPYHESWGGFHFSGDYAFNLGVGISEIPHNLGKSWFPCIDDFTDRATYDVYATVNDDVTAVGGGELMGITDHPDNTRTFHWKMHYPIPTYLISIATGDYVLIEDTYNGAERDIPITYYVRPVDTVKVPGNFANLKEITEIYEEHFGPYAWERIGYVGTNLGAMEHATSIAYPNSTITGNANYEWLYAHELSHMWFGDKVTCASAEEMWLNEGWAVFCEVFYTEILYNEETFKETMMEKHAFVLQNAHIEENGYWPLNQLPQEYTYGTSAYDKGATVVQSLRNYLGDSIFFSTMRAYLDSFAFTSRDSYEMRDFITGHSGIDVGGFFDNWVFNGGTPHYSIDSFNVTPDLAQFPTTVYIKQKRKGPYFIGDDNIAEISFIGDNWEKHADTLHFDGVTGHSTIDVPFQPVLALIDLDDNMYDATTGESLVLNETGEYDFENTFFRMEVQQISDSAYINVTHNWAPPDSLKTPVPNLKISDYRYWKIQGIVPSDFIAKGRFHYSSSSLDPGILTSPSDSVVLLHRPDPSADWQPIEFTQLGPWNIGYLYVDNMPMGEYTLAAWDLQVGEDEEFTGSLDNNKYMDIFPNPASKEFTLTYDTDKPAVISILDMNGKLIEEFSIPAGSKQLKKDTGFLSEGMYLFRLQSIDKEYLCTQKLVIVK